MATIKYFSGEVQVFHPAGMPNEKFAKAFGAAKALKHDDASKYVGFAADTTAWDHVNFRGAKPLTHFVVVLD